MDATRSPVRERRDSYVGTFSLSSRSGLQTDIVILYVTEFTADYSRLLRLKASAHVDTYGEGRLPLPGDFWRSVQVEASGLQTP